MHLPTVRPLMVPADGSHQARPRKAFLAFTGLPRPDRRNGDSRAPLLPAVVLVDDVPPPPPSPSPPQTPAAAPEAEPCDAPSSRRLSRLLRCVMRKPAALPTLLPAGQCNAL